MKPCRNAGSQGLRCDTSARERLYVQATVPQLPCDLVYPKFATASHRLRDFGCRSPQEAVSAETPDPHVRKHYVNTNQSLHPAVEQSDSPTPSSMIELGAIEKEQFDQRAVRRAQSTAISITGFTINRKPPPSLYRKRYPLTPRMQRTAYNSPIHHRRTPDDGARQSFHLLPTKAPSLARYARCSR